MRVINTRLSIFLLSNWALAACLYSLKSGRKVDIDYVHVFRVFRFWLRSIYIVIAIRTCFLQHSELSIDKIVLLQHPSWQLNLWHLLKSARSSSTLIHVIHEAKNLRHCLKRLSCGSAELTSATSFAAAVGLACGIDYLSPPCQGPRPPWKEFTCSKRWFRVTYELSQHRNGNKGMNVTTPYPFPSSSNCADSQLIWNCRLVNQSAKSCWQGIYAWLCIYNTPRHQEKLGP